MPSVLLDLRMVQGPLHGIARYALELARRLPRLAPDWHFRMLVPPGGLPRELGPLLPGLPELRARARFLSPLEQPDLAALLLRARHPGLKVIVSTGYGHSALTESASALEGVHLLPKPYDRSLLLGAIRDAIKPVKTQQPAA